MLKVKALYLPRRSPTEAGQPAEWDGWDGSGRRLGRPESSRNPMFIGIETVGRFPQGGCISPADTLCRPTLSPLRSTATEDGSATLSSRLVAPQRSDKI